MRFLLGIFFMLMSVAALADEFVFESIDGGVIDLRDYNGKAVLVVNTASRCGFTRQYAGLQKLYERYHEDGLVVLAVPSHDFKQELKEDELVKQFCEINYGLTLPMTSITKIKGTDAHPFFAWLKREHGFSPLGTLTKCSWTETENMLQASVRRQGQQGDAFQRQYNPSLQDYKEVRAKDLYWPSSHCPSGQKA